MRPRTPRTRDILAFPVLALSACAPAPDATEPCPAGSVLDGATCVPEACATGTWGAVEVDADTVYVDAAAEPGGDGSAERPLQSVQAGADVAAERGGRLVAIASGTYTEALMLGSRHDGLTLAGRCAEGVVLVGSATSESGVVVELARSGREQRPTLTLDNLTVTGGTRGGINVYTADLVGRRLRIEENISYGVLLERATATLTDVTVARTAALRQYGTGIWAFTGSSLALRDVTVEDSTDGIFVDESHELVMHDVRVRRTTRNFGVVALGVDTVVGDDVVIEDCAVGGFYALEGTVASLRNLTVRGASRINDDSGYGLAVALGATVDVDGLSVSETDTFGVYVITGDTTLHVRNGDLSGNVGYGVHVREGARSAGSDVPSVHLEDVRIAENGYGGVAVLDGARLVADGVDVDRNGHVGVHLIHAAESDGEMDVELHDVRITGTRNIGPLDPPAPSGLGFAAEGPMAVRGSEVVIEHNELGGAYLLYGADARFEDCSISRNRPGPDGLYGLGIEASTGSRLHLERCTLEGNHGSGVNVGGEGTQAALVDTMVTGTLRSLDPTSAASKGSGVNVRDGGSVTLVRTTLADSPAQGLVVSGTGAVADVTDTVIRGTYQTTAGTYGRGVTVARGGRLHMARSTVADNVDAGVVSHGNGSHAELTGCVVEGTRIGRRGRLAAGVVTAGGGTLVATDLEVRDTEGPGAYLYFDGTVSLDRADLHDNTFAGAAVLGDGTLELRDSHVHDNGADPNLGGGLGVVARNLDGAPVVRVESTQVDPHIHSALWFDGPGSYTVLGSRLTGGIGVPRGETRIHGNAIVGLRGIVAATAAYGDGLFVSDNELVQATGAAILLDGAATTLDGNTWSGNALDILQQRCDLTSPLLEEDISDVPSATLCPPGASLIDTTLEVPDYEPADVALDE